MSTLMGGISNQGNVYQCVPCYYCDLLYELMYSQGIA